MNNSQLKNKGFTLIELIVVIIVLSILAAIVMIGYGTWRITVANKEVQSDLQLAASAMENARDFGSGYPTSIPSTFRNSPNVTVSYFSGDSGSFCITGTSTVVPSVSYYVNSSSGSKPLAGTCTGGGGGGTIASGDPMQIVTNSNCPASRTKVVDARDNHTYWVQKLADGKCWMLTNMAYKGGGTNTYGDVKALTFVMVVNSSNSEPFVYEPNGSNPTTSPTSPSTSTNGTGQYGYIYNWCAAMGGQTGTGACGSMTSPAPNTSISSCPSGWRLPSGNGGEFAALNNAVNSGSATTDAGLRTTWLAQYGGYWSGDPYSLSFYLQGSLGGYWSSTQYDADKAYHLVFQSNFVNTADRNTKDMGYTVRCVTSA